jgi:hypothetical protein
VVDFGCSVPFRGSVKRPGWNGCFVCRTDDIPDTALAVYVRDNHHHSKSKGFGVGYRNDEWLELLEAVVVLLSYHDRACADFLDRFNRLRRERYDVEVIDHRLISTMSFAT